MSGTTKKAMMANLIYLLIPQLTIAEADRVFRLYREKDELVLRENKKRYGVVFLQAMQVAYKPSEEEWDAALGRLGQCIRSIWPSGMMGNVNMAEAVLLGLLFALSFVEWLGLSQAAGETDSARGHGSMGVVVHDGQVAFYLYQMPSGMLAWFFDAPLVRQLVKQVEARGKLKEFEQFAQTCIARVFAQLVSTLGDAQKL